MPKERFEKLCKIDFQFSINRLHSPEPGIDAEINPQQKTIGEKFVLPDAPSSSTVLVVPEACLSSTGDTSKTEEKGDDHEIFNNMEDEVETEDDLTEVDDIGDEGEVDDQDYHSTAATDNKNDTFQTNMGNNDKERRASARLRMLESDSSRVESDAIIPDGALSCAEVAIPEMRKIDETSDPVGKMNDLINNRKWYCEKCGKTEFDFFVEAMHHQATCSGLQLLAIDPMTSLS